MVLTLRPYQQDAHDAHWSRLDSGETSNPLVVVPTGGGKSLLVAEFIREALRRNPNVRILVLAHVKELIEQNSSELLSQMADEPRDRRRVGVLSAGLGRRDYDSQILFAGIQTASTQKSLRMIGGGVPYFDHVLIDEAHLFPFKGNGQYRTMIAAILAANPKAIVHGYTATHFRLDGGFLHEGEGSIFDDIAYEVPVERLIAEGHLAPLVARYGRNGVDTSGVRTVAGDYARGELNDAACNEDVTKAAVDEIVAAAKEADRKSWLIFGCGVDHSEMVASEIATRGISVGVIFGKTPADERDEMIRRFKAGKITALVNHGVLTTGFNAPRIDLMAILRPTKSVSLYVQMMGRGMRNAPGKTDCLVLDFGNNVARHGPINRLRIKTPGEEEGSAPFKKCPNCEASNPAGSKFCWSCGFEFPPPQKDPHQAQSSDLEIVEMSNEWMQAEVDQGWSVVRYVKASLNEKTKQDPRTGGFTLSRTVKVTYGLKGMRAIEQANVSEWICPEHGGIARRKFEKWWKAHAKDPSADLPSTCEEVIEAMEAGKLREPFMVKVLANPGSLPSFQGRRLSRLTAEA